MESRLRRGLTHLARGAEWQAMATIQSKIGGGAQGLLKEAEVAGWIDVRRRRVGASGPERREVRITRAGMLALGA